MRLAQLLTGAPPRCKPKLTHLTAAVRRPLQFYRPDGFAVGYFETDASGFEEAGGRMDSFDVNAVWVRACSSSLLSHGNLKGGCSQQEAMSKYTPANTSPIDAAMELEHYFVSHNCAKSCLSLAQPNTMACAHSTSARTV